MMTVQYVCSRPGCWNLTTEVWCLGHRLEVDAKKASKRLIENLNNPPVSSSRENPDPEDQRA